LSTSSDAFARLSSSSIASSKAAGSSVTPSSMPSSGGCFHVVPVLLQNGLVMVTGRPPGDGLERVDGGIVFFGSTIPRICHRPAMRLRGSVNHGDSDKREGSYIVPTVLFLRSTFWDSDSTFPEWVGCLGMVADGFLCGNRVIMGGNGVAKCQWENCSNSNCSDTGRDP